MSKITKSAKGQPCQIRIPDICNHNTETTVFAHLNGGGVGMKQPDYLGAYACSHCHDVVDRRDRLHGYSQAEVKTMFYEGIFRTQTALFKQGLLKIGG